MIRRASRGAGAALGLLLLAAAVAPGALACRGHDAAGATLYQRLGGDKGMDALMDAFLDRVAADPRINSYFVDSDMGKLRTQFVSLMGQATGGPQHYDGPDIATIHKDMGIGTADFDAFVQDLRAALHEREVRSHDAEQVVALIEGMRGMVVTKAR